MNSSTVHPNTMRAGLTPSQRRLLGYLGDFIARNGYSPSFAEMRDGMGFGSTGAVASLVDGLEERGYVSRLPGRHRSLALTVAQPLLAHQSVSRETPAAPSVGAGLADASHTALRGPEAA